LPILPDDPHLAQLAWHLGLAARYAAFDQTVLARTETLLAWAVVATAGVTGVDEMTTFDEPIDLGDTSAGDGRLATAFEDARDAALALIGHFTSEQRFELVGLYEAVLVVIEDVLARLGRATASTDTQTTT
jgi:hypothetical protein